MKIWFDTVSQNQRTSNQERRRDECKSDCPIQLDVYEDVLQEMKHLEVGGEQVYLYTGMLQYVQPLYLQSFMDIYTQACSPTGSGTLVVLDAEALAVLQCFRYPITLNEVIQRFDYLSRAQIEEVTAYFYGCGLLRNMFDPIRTSVARSADTLVAWLHVTNVCNLRCDYCYIEKSSEHMQEDTAQQAIDAIFRSAVKHHFKEVRLQYGGGEASLQSDRVIALHDYALSLAQQHHLKLSAYIMSNGVYLSTHMIEQLKSRNIGVMISLDGLGTYHDSQRSFVGGRGSFTRVDRTITRLIEYNLLPDISVTVSSRNIAGIPALLQYLLKRNLFFSLNYYRENNLSAHLVDMQLDEERMIAGMREAFTLIAEHLPRYSLLNSLIDKANLQAPHNHTCGVGKNYMVINQRGEVAKCQVEMKQTVTTIAADDPLQFIREDRTGVQGLSVDEKEGCRDCTWRYWCTGGCPALTYRMTGRYDIQSPNCHIYQSLFPDALQLEALRLLLYTTPIVI